MDAQRLKDNFAQVAAQGDSVALFFYSDLFVRNPHLRDMFPIGMSGQRDKLLRALGHIVAKVDDLQNLVPFLQQLGRDHRRFGIIAEHYPHVGGSLLATLRHFSGPAWTDELESDWNAAYSLVAKVMLEAADEDALNRPAWWNGQVIGVERRRFDITVLRVQPDRPIPFQPGQSVALEVPARLRHWRYYSMANAPRPDHTVDFHVRLVDGGPVSPVLVRGMQTGDRVRMGAPIGTLTLDESSTRDVLLVAGSTGLAPLKAILEQIAGRPSPPRVHLFFGARDRDGLYDLEDLTKMAGDLPWLTVVPAVSDETSGHGFSTMLQSGQLQTGQFSFGQFSPGGSETGQFSPGGGLQAGGSAAGGDGIEQGNLPDVVARRGPWHDHDAYVCGPDEMVRSTVERLGTLGVGRERIRLESFADAQR